MYSFFEKVFLTTYLFVEFHSQCERKTLGPTTPDLKIRVMVSSNSIYMGCFENMNIGRLLRIANLLKSKARPNRKIRLEI